jgi:predicted  nucleic acid-binding Zn-ribbon protein
MTISSGALCELHRIHRQLADLRERLDRGPKQIAAQEANVKRLEQAVAQAKETLKQARMAADARQLQLKEREQRIVQVQGKLNQCTTNREFQALKEQIAADEQANSVLADEILEMLDKLDEHQANIKSAEASLGKANDEMAKIREKVAAQRGDLEAEQARVMADLKRAELSLPDDFREAYDRMVKSRGENALAPLEGDCCGNCYQTVTVQMQNLLKMNKPVFCQSCGSLLYPPEDSSPLGKEK